MPTTLDSEPEPTTRRRGPLGCKPLLDAATKNLFRKNAFRITGLPVDATPGERQRHVNKLMILVETGQDPHTQTAAFPMKPPPSLDEIREAIPKLIRPEERLIDEFFWFWPEEFGNSQSDPAMQALTKGDSKTAVEIWVSRENGAQSSITAKHNLALVNHVFALDAENNLLKNAVEAEPRQKIANYWKGAFTRWESLATSEQFWEIVVARIRQSKEDSLKGGFARRMRATLPEALDKINAELAVAFAESGKIGLARLHIQFMRGTNQGLDNVEKTAELVLTPAKNRLQDQVRRAKERADKDPRDAANAARELLGQAEQPLAIFSLFFGEESEVRNELAVEVLEAIYSSMQSGLNFIQKSTVHPKSKLDQVRAVFFEILPDVESFGGKYAKSSPISTKVMDAVAWALRGIAIEAYNEYRDSGTTFEGLDAALQWSRGPEVRQRIQADLKTLGVEPGATPLRQPSASGSQPKQKGQTTVRRLPSPFGDAGGEHTRMERGSYDAGMYVVFAVIAEIVCAGILGLSFITNILKIPCDETASWIVGGLAGLGITLLVLWNRWKCVEAFSSQSCCGVANLSMLYVPVVAFIYANWRGVKKVFDRREWEDSGANKSSRLALVASAIVLVLGIVGFRDGDKPASTSNSYTPAPAPQYSPPVVRPTSPANPFDQFDKPTTPSPSRATPTYSVPSYTSAELDKAKEAIDSEKAKSARLEALLEQSTKAVETQKAETDELDTNLETLSRQIERDRINLDRTSQYDIDSFNLKVNRYNSALRNRKAEVEVYNQMVDSHNTLVQQLKTQNRLVNQMVDDYNAKLQRYGR